MSGKVLNQVHGSKAGFAKKYTEMHVGNMGLLFLLKYECLTLLFGNLPGALGLALRAITYRGLFKKVGKGVVFGRNITLRNPKSIVLGDRVILDDYCVLDAKGDEDPGIIIGSNVFVSRNVILGCKHGAIKIGSDVTIGPNCTFHSVDDSHIEIGDFTIIAGHCYFAGGANYQFDRVDIPIVKQEWSKGVGIKLGRDVWIGGSVVVLDGAQVGDGAIIGAQSLLKGELPSLSIAFGAPAKVKGQRGAAQ